jgi:hypothetical protein
MCQAGWKRNSNSMLLNTAPCWTWLLPKRAKPASYTPTHLHVGPRVAQHHLARLAVDVPKRVVDVGEMLVRDLLRWELAAVDPPG